MFAKAKLWVIGALGAISAVLLALLKIKQSELDVAKEKQKIYEANEKLDDAKEKADEKALKQFWKDKKKIEEEHESKFKKADKTIDSRPLSPSSIELLKSGSTEGDSDSTP